MSAVPTQKESVEPGWSGLEALGLSQKELVLAEALQMEYDALTRLRQDKSGPAETGSTGSPGSPGSPGSRPPARSKTPNPTVERPRPVPSQPVAGSLRRGLSGSDPSLDQPGGSRSPGSAPSRPLPPPPPREATSKSPRTSWTARSRSAS